MLALVKRQTGADRVGHRGPGPVLQTLDPPSRIIAGEAARPASAAAPVPMSYAAFQAAVVDATLTDWLPAAQPGAVLTVLDLSGDASCAAVLAGTGHRVVCVLDPAAPQPQPADLPDGVQYLRADPRVPDWLRTESLDLVVAESGVLSRCLAFEETLTHLARSLRPGGRLLLAVDSLVSGLADLAEHGRWAELADAPSAEVVLVPDDDGGATRVYWPTEVDACLAVAGLATEWIRPRTVLPEDAVERSRRQGDVDLAHLVRMELDLEAERTGEAIGHRLVASARKPC